MPASDDVADPAPWAPGGSMSTGWPHGVAHRNGAPSPSEPPPSSDTAPTRSRWLPVVGVFALIVGIAVVFALRSPTGPEKSEPSAVADPEVSASIDPTTTSASSLDALGEIATTVAVAADETTSDDQTAAGSTPFATIEPADVSLIDVPRELAGIGPVEIVALSSTDGLVEISIPSGRVRSTEVDTIVARTRLEVTDFGALMWSTSSSEISYDWFGADGHRARRAGREVHWVSSTPGRDEFLLWHSASSTLSATSLETSQGRPVERDEPWAVTEGHPITYVDPAGGLLFPDTGGWYRLDESGVQRITTGDVLATGRNHVLVRECDQQRICSLTSIDADGVRTLFSGELPDDLSPLSFDGLSPTGDAVLTIAERTATATPSEVHIFDLVDNSRVTLFASTGAAPTATWAPDGSGVFFAASQLVFHDRATGVASIVSADLPNDLRDVTARVPLVDPVCELVVPISAVFDDMQLDGGTSVAPPAIALLDRFHDLAPEDLGAATAPLVAFVGAFVSAEQPESQRIVNWPADVQAGVAALAAHSDAECSPT